MGFGGVLALVIAVSMASIALLAVKLNDSRQTGNDGANLHAGESPLLPASSMILVRASFAVVIFSAAIYQYFEKQSIPVDLSHGNGITKRLYIRPRDRFCMFTMWAWLIQGVYYTSAAFVGYQEMMNATPMKDVNDSSTVVVQIMFEISFTLAYLVTIAVNKVLVPASIARNDNPDNFFKPLPLLMHNANVLFITVDMLLNKLPFNSFHFPYATLVGVLYVLFTWLHFLVRGFFYYFFVDFTRKDAVLCHAGLITGLVLFFFGGYGASMIIQSQPLVGRIAVLICCYLSLRLLKPPSPKDGALLGVSNDRTTLASDGVSTAE
jgi:hypothetical protein